MLNCSTKITSNSIFPGPVALPEEVVIHIFSFLSPKDVILCETVNREWKRLCRDPALWKWFALKLGISNAQDGDWQKAVIRYKQIENQLDQVLLSTNDFTSLRKGKIVDLLINFINNKYPCSIHQVKPFSKKLPIDNITFFIQKYDLFPNISFHVVHCETGKKWLLRFAQEDASIGSTRWIRLRSYREYTTRAGVTTLFKIKPDFPSPNESYTVFDYDEKTWTSLKELIKNGESTLRLGSSYHRFKLYFPNHEH